eukprot:CAMPEP_0167764362 /NCGR_PEP_ID=MMETSP0110_2-20121227/13982_1 /TAXON_ID=629695 /ORGANISM="Gymnochlora sp., Strain CCMP2014" /LENGTH=997 /DNA_ID=CAMNT_0007651741 /DNA_START=35 /DNA_END=3028 /DNA_ORIENTATION=+
MPLRLDVQKVMSMASERVKCCDIHPIEPWVLSALYSGHVIIWNYETQSSVKSFEVCDLPVRCAKFIAKKQWFVCGTDDMKIQVYNYNTMERVHSFEAHSDYIRCIAVHPTLPIILSSSDDMFIKMWDWEKNWENRRVYEGHSHYVMQVEFNPKDPHTFASASLDHTIKIWGLTSSSPHFSLEGHERGINCVSYFQGGDKPYLVSGADDCTVKIWDYQTRTCIKTLVGHQANVSAVCFHPELPIILSGSEDGTVRLWHSLTFTLENTFNYAMERVWALAYQKGSNKVAIGFDEGTVMVQIGQEEPVVSMDQSGKVLFARIHEIVQKNVRHGDKKIADGERLELPAKELGTCDLYPQSLKHNRNGRLVCACGDGEYVIYTSLRLKNKNYGQAIEFCWANDSGTYAIRETTSKLKVFKNFKKHRDFRPRFTVEGIFGGTLLAARGAKHVDFYDWEECRLIRRISVLPKKIFWSDSGDLCIIACKSTFYVLRYNRDLVAKFLSDGSEIGDNGIEKSFDLEKSVPESVETGHFVGDCFLFTNSAQRLCYYIGGQTIILAHLDRPMFLLGYLVKENRVYLMDKQYNVVSYRLLMSVLIYQIAIVRKDFEMAQKALRDIPIGQHNKIARFLEGQELKELALKVSRDPDHRFDLALQLKKLDEVKKIVVAYPSEAKWKQLGDLALAESFDLKLTEECFTKAKDFGGLLLLYTSLGSGQGVRRLAAAASKAGKNNVAFICYYLLNNVEECIKLLCTNGRIPEAAFMSRTYRPNDTKDILVKWKEHLSTISTKAAEALADPDTYPKAFPDFKQACNAQIALEAMEKKRGMLPALKYLSAKPLYNMNVIKEFKNFDISKITAETPAASVTPETTVEVKTKIEEEKKTVAPVKEPEPEPEPEPKVEPEEKKLNKSDELTLDPTAELELEPEEEVDPTPVKEEKDDLDIKDTLGGGELDANLDDELEGLDNLDVDGPMTEVGGPTPTLDELNQTLAELDREAKVDEDLDF